MGLDELKDHLEKKARTEAKEILEAARLEANAVRAERIATAEAEAERLQEKVKTAERKGRGLIVQARREASTIIRSAYDQVTERAMQRTLHDLAGLSGPDYDDYISRSVAKGRELLGDFSVLITRETDRELIVSLGHNVAGTVKGYGGVVLITEGGKRLDMRFKSLLEELRPRIRQMVASELEV